MFDKNTVPNPHQARRKGITFGMIIIFMGIWPLGNEGFHYFMNLPDALEGSIYPVTFFALALSLLFLRISIHNNLDKFFILYVFTAILSTMVNGAIFILNDVDDFVLWSMVKSLVAFSFCYVFFFGKKITYEEFFWGVMPLLALSAIHVFFNLYFLIAGNVDVISIRQQMGGLIPGFMTRYIVFMGIGACFSVAGYVFTRRTIFIVLSAIFLIDIVFSQTRSAILGIIITTLWLLNHLFSRVPFVRIMKMVLLLAVLLVAISLVYDNQIGFFISRIEHTLGVLQKFSEIKFDLSEDKGSDIFRIVLWTSIVKSLWPARILFGWGQLAVVYTLKYCGLAGPDANLGSAHSQFFDILNRQGLLGIGLYYGMLYSGYKMSMKLYRAAVDQREKLFWFGGSMGIIFSTVHGLFVESTRFVPFGFYMFTYLGLVSGYYFKSMRPMGRL